MPELPEVETTRRGIVPHLEQRRICAVQVREGVAAFGCVEDHALVILECVVNASDGVFDDLHEIVNS